MIHLIKLFGLKKFPLKQLLKPMETAVGSKNAVVRQLALSFYEEWFKWVGGAIQPAVDKLNKSQQEELGKIFAKFTESGEGKPKASRITKVEEENQKQVEIDEIWAKEEEEEKIALEVLDLEEEQDVLVKYDAAWAESLLALKKWSDK